MLLSILICTIPERENQLSELMNELLDQIENNNLQNLVEIQIKDDFYEIHNNLPRLRVGKKRQSLLEKSNGEYVCFIDDDDWVSKDYAKKIVDAIQKNNKPDCIGFLQDYLVDGKECIGGRNVCISLKYEKWDLNVDGFLAVRTPNHLSPIKRKLCIECGGYENLEKAEDFEFSTRIRPFLKTECFINEKLYFYRKKTINEHNLF